MSEVLKKDISDLLHGDFPVDEVKGKSFLVTGATGLVGSLFAKTILQGNRELGFGCKIVAVVRNIEKAKETFADYLDDNKLSFLICDLAKDSIKTEQPIDYIVHAAAVTTSKDMVTYPVDNIMLSVMGTRTVLEFARLNSVKAVVYLSSMEVYGQMFVSDHKIKEDELGFVDLTAARSCYPEGKRMCECLCNAYAAQYDVNVMSARLAQTFGPGILKNENRVFAQFAKSAINGTDIVLHTKGESEGNYVYTMDAVCAIVTLLLRGSKGEAYNVSNAESHMTIAEMGEMVATKVAGGKIKLVFDIPEDANKLGYAPTTKMHLDNTKMCALGWKPRVSLQETYERLIAYMCE